MRLSLPVFLELLISSLFGMVDMMMVGNSGSPEITTPSIAATGITNQLVFIAIALAQALSAGGTAMISRYSGAREDEKIGPVVRHVLLLNLALIGLPFLVLTQARPVELMAFIGAQADTIAIGLKYLKIIGLGFVFQALNLAIFASMRGVGDTRTPMLINIGVNLLNVFGNYILIFGRLGLRPLGLTGAGISTSLSHLLAFLILLMLLARKESSLKLGPGQGLRPNGKILKNLLKIGGPAALEQVGFRLGVVVFIKIVSSLGTAAYATHQIASNIISLSFAPGQAFGIAASTLVGRSLGEGRLDRAENFIKKSNRLALASSALFFLIFYFLGPSLVGLYSRDPEILGLSQNVMKLIALIQPFQASAFAISGGLRGAGDTVSTLIVTIIGVFIIRIGLAHILIRELELGLVGAWLAMLADQIIRWLGIGLRYRQGRWKEIEL